MLKGSDTLIPLYTTGKINTRASCFVPEVSKTFGQIQGILRTIPELPKHEHVCTFSWDLAKGHSLLHAEAMLLLHKIHGVQRLGH